MGVMFLIIIIVIIFFVIDHGKFEDSDYKEETGKGYLETLFDKGSEGEYRTSTQLKHLSGKFKMIVNAYIPKSNEHSTTEIDIIVIHEKGIFAIENKNYTGWIFGEETSKNWCETFPTGKKIFFYNPVKQNQSHIKYLKKYLDKYKEKQIPYISVIVFNSDATIKKMKIVSDNIIVGYSHNYTDKINDLIEDMPVILNEDEINGVYTILKEKNRVPDEIKQKHIQEIKNREN